MCGILGSGGFTPDVTAMLPYLGLMMQARGVDAWGGTNGYDMMHELGAFSNSWAMRRAEIEQWDQGIFHTRGASVGAGDNIAFAHPFREEFTDASGRAVIGIHNGCIRNWKALNTKYSRQLGCDSMQLWRQMAEGRSWDELEGTAALAWYEIDAQGERALYLAHVDNPELHLVEVSDGGLVFASEMKALELAARMVGSQVVKQYTIEPHTIYRLGERQVFKTAREVRFAKPAPTPQRAGFYPKYDQRNIQGCIANAHPIDCKRCGTPLGDTKKLLCIGCTTTLYSMWRVEWHKLHPEDATVATASDVPYGTDLSDTEAYYA